MVWRIGEASHPGPVGLSDHSAGFDDPEGQLDLDQIDLDDSFHKQAGSDSLEIPWELLVEQTDDLCNEASEHANKDERSSTCVSDQG